MNFSRISVLAFVFAISGCATVHNSAPPKSTFKDSASSISSSTALPAPDHLPELSVVAPGTKYIMVQSAGGNILLGPILGSMNIATNTKEMAEKYKDSVLNIDPTPMAFAAMEKVGIRNSNNAASFVAKPFVFVQRCYDERFRISLVFHVDGAGQSSDWVGRYTYHLPTSYSVAQFGSLTAEQIANYKSELTEGAATLTNLM